jgi:hypothetical protein
LKNSRRKSLLRSYRARFRNALLRTAAAARNAASEQFFRPLLPALFELICTHAEN